MLLVLAHRKLRQESSCRFEAVLGYIMQEPISRKQTKIKPIKAAIKSHIQLEPFIKMLNISPLFPLFIFFVRV